MVQSLSEPVEDSVRKYLYDNINPTQIEGYDPTQSDTTQSDYILLTSDNSRYGDYYPMIFVTQNDNGPILPDSGDSNVSSVQGDGSGTNQFAVYDVTVSVQTVEDETYRNGVEYDALAHTIYSHIHTLFSSPGLVGDPLHNGRITPSTQSRSETETDSGSTTTWIQKSGTVPLSVNFTP